jgi:branched-chain amino acid transport system permease protein
MAFPAPIAAVSWELVAQLTVGGVVLGSTYALLGLSFGLIYSTTGIFHFAHAVVYTIAAYAAVVFLNDLGLPWPAALALGIVVAVALGMAIEGLAYRPMRSAGGTPMAIFLVSLGLTTLAPNLLQIIFGTENQTFGAYSPEIYSLGTTIVTSLDIATVVVSWILIVGVLVFLKRTRQGLATTAVRVNRQMAAAVGISPDRVHLLVFGLGSALVAVPALLFLLNGVASPTMGLSPVLTALIAVFVGGVGSMAGAALGGFVLGMLTSLSALWLSSNYQLVVVFGILFVFVIVRPQGLFGRPAR